MYIFITNILNKLVYIYKIVISLARILSFICKNISTISIGHIYACFFKYLSSYSLH